MPERSVFGRRMPAVLDMISRRPASGDSADAVDPTRVRLTSMTERLWLWGDLIGFAGVALIVLASVLASADTTLTEIDDVAVPFAWAKTLTGVPISGQSVQILMPSLYTMQWLLIVGLGVIGILRKRWLLVGLSLITLLFPWPWLGFAMKLGPMLAGLLLTLAFIRLWRPGKLMLAVLVVGFLIVAPIATAIFSNAVSALYVPNGYPSERYARLGDGTKTPQNYADLINSLQDVQTASPEDAGLKAFALAEAYTLVGDAASAQASLRTLSRLDFIPNFFEAHRIAVISNFVVSAGLEGPEAQAELGQRALQHGLLLAVVNSIALVLVVIGPFLDLFGKGLARRNARIADFQHRIHIERARLDRAAMPSDFGAEAGVLPVQSLTALDGEKIVAGIKRRLKLYHSGFWILVMLAGVGLFFGAAMALPPAHENSAFDSLALSGPALEWARKLGLEVIKGPQPVGNLLLVLLGPVLVIIALTAIFARRYMRFVIYPLIAVFLYAQLASVFFIDHARFEIPRSAVPPGLMDVLDFSLPAQAVAPSSGSTGALAATDNKLSYPSWQAPSEAGVLPIADAAYVLAQAAYIDGRVDEVARLLPLAVPAVEVGDNAAAQRFDIMQEWVGMNGLEMSLKADLKRLIVPMAWTRAAATPVTLLGIVATVLAASAIALMLIGHRRATRITRLVAEVQSMRAASGALVNT